MAYLRSNRRYGRLMMPTPARPYAPRRLFYARGKDMPEAPLPCNPFSDAELAFFRRFIREPSVSRNGMLKNTVDRWGLCTRHTLGLLVVSASVPRAGLHTTAVLHQAILEHAIRALRRCASTGDSYGDSLRDNESCPMCELGLNENSTGLIRREWLTTPHSLKRLRSLLDDTREQWSGFVCGTCVDSAAGPSCRAHAVVALQTGDEATVLRTLDEQRSLLDTLNLRLERFLQTFSPESEGVNAGEGVAALVAAAGWCAGWQTLSQAVGPSLAGGNVQGGRSSPQADRFPAPSASSRVMDGT